MSFLPLCIVLLLAQGPAIVSAPLLEAATDNPLRFVQVLAEAGIPAGLELRSADLPISGRRNVDRTHREYLQAQPVVALSDVVDAFNRSHGDYRAMIDRGVVIVRPAGPRAMYMDTRPLSGRIEAVGLMSFAERVFAPLDRTLGLSGGRAGSRLGPIGVDVDYGDDLSLTVDGAEHLTAVEILNEVARQAPGHPWIVITSGGDEPTVRRFGFAHRYGTTEVRDLRQ